MPNTNLPDNLIPLDNTNTILNRIDTSTLSSNDMHITVSQHTLDMVNSIQNNFTVRNPHEKTENLLTESNLLLQEQNNKIDSLQSQLEYSNIQLKQANDKISSQNLYIKELKADLKEETQKRIAAENKLSSKDWKTALIAIVTGIIILGIEHWKSVVSFIASLF